MALATSDMKDRQLIASLNTMLGIIHKLLVVICAVSCDAFICNSSTQLGSCLASVHLPLQRQIRQIRQITGKPKALLKKKKGIGIFIMSLSVHNAQFILAFFWLFARELMCWFTAKNEIQNQALEV